MKLDSDYDPASCWAAWIGHWFPSISPQHMAGLTFEQLIGMYEFATKSGSGG